jgi:hypothetical protein
MKSTTSLPLTLAILSLSSSCLRAQSPTASEKISKEFTVAGDAGKQVLALYNIFGSVAVQGYAGDKVLVEVTKTISAADGTLVETGKKEVQLGFIQRNDSIIVYTAGPQDSRPNRQIRTQDHWNENGPHYKYKLDYTVKVPRQLNVRVSTVNEGKVDIQDVAGTLHAYNVNGAITIKNAKGATIARTVNGNVDASYTSNPAGACSYNTVNGQITAIYPPNTGAEVHFKSFHGELFTDFAQAELLPVQVSQNKQGEGGGTRYKLSKDTAVRLGKGGTDLRFETLNGNVTIKQQVK